MTATASGIQRVPQEIIVPLEQDSALHLEAAWRLHPAGGLGIIYFPDQAKARTLTRQDLVTVMRTHHSIVEAMIAHRGKRTERPYWQMVFCAFFGDYNVPVMPPLAEARAERTFELNHGFELKGYDVSFSTTGPMKQVLKIMAQVTSPGSRMTPHRTPEAALTSALSLLGSFPPIDT